MIVSKHRVDGNFDIGPKKKATKTLEKYSFVHFNETPPRGFVFSWPLTVFKDLQCMGYLVIFDRKTYF